MLSLQVANYKTLTRSGMDTQREKVSLERKNFPGISMHLMYTILLDLLILNISMILCWARMVLIFIFFTLTIQNIMINGRDYSPKLPSK